MASLVCPASAKRSSGNDRVVLGSHDFVGPYGKGFGTPHPKKIFNGGVPSGLIEKIRWRNWGKRVAIGRGLGNQYKPSGGYYAHHVIVRMRAVRLSRCDGSRIHAYTRLRVSFEKRPGSGRFTRWFNWSGANSICGSGY